MILRSRQGRKGKSEETHVDSAMSPKQSGFYKLALALSSGNRRDGGGGCGDASDDDNVVSANLQSRWGWCVGSVFAGIDGDTIDSLDCSHWWVHRQG